MTRIEAPATPDNGYSPAFSGNPRQSSTLPSAVDPRCPEVSTIFNSCERDALPFGQLCASTWLCGKIQCSEWSTKRYLSMDFLKDHQLRKTTT